MCASAAILEQAGAAAKRALEYVDPAIVINVPKRRAPARNGNLGARIGSNEAAVPIQSDHGRLQIMEQWIDLFYIVHHVALHHKQVLPAIVVEVFQPHAPTGTPR